MKNLICTSYLKKILSKLFLAFVLLGIFSFSVYASANTYEVIAKRDLPQSSVIKEVRLTKHVPTNDTFASSIDNNYASGSFGIPQKLKLPESSKHIELVSPIYEKSEWKASKGIGHVLVSDKPRQKVFGQALIYARVNTATTRNLGEVFKGDTVNVVTSEGWLLGYRVTDIADDLALLDIQRPEDSSEIIVVLIDEISGNHTNFRAVLERVGDRI